MRRLKNKPRFCDWQVCRRCACLPRSNGCGAGRRRSGCSCMNIPRTRFNKADAAQSPIPCGLKNKLFLFLTSSLFYEYIFKCNAVVKCWYSMSYLICLFFKRKFWVNFNDGCRLYPRIFVWQTNQLRLGRIPHKGSKGTTKGLKRHKGHKRRKGQKHSSGENATYAIPFHFLNTFCPSLRGST